MSNIIPTIFSHNEEEFKARLTHLLPASDQLQIDYMDGSFVEGRSITLDATPNLNAYPNSFEAHLMVKRPHDWLEALARKGFSRVIVHIEAARERIGEIITHAHMLDMQAAIAINPGTDPELLAPHLGATNHLLFMGIHPGKEKQQLLETTYDRIRSFCTAHRDALVQVDGGVSPTTIGKLWRSGARLFNSGSFVADAKEPKEAIKALEQAIEEGRA